MTKPSSQTLKIIITKPHNINIGAKGGGLNNTKQYKNFE
jgi:hypothetical protein